MIGAIAGNAALGAGVGLAGGLIADRVEKNKDAAYQEGYVAGASE